MDKIYIVVPVYKVEAYLERCIDSILNQTYTNWELVLVDDGSPDNCPAICDRYAEQHDNITVIHQENGGLSAARNTGIEHAMKQGDPEHDWITFIDSDDFIHPKYLEYLHRAAKDTGTEISSCAYFRTDIAGIPAGEIPYSYTTLTPEEFWRTDRTNALIACAKLFRLFILEGVQFPVGKLHEDEFTTYKVLFRCSNMAVLHTALYYYFFNSTSITHTDWSPKRLDALDALEEQIVFFRINGFRIARTLSTRDLFQHSIKHLMYIRHLSPRYDDYINIVKKRRNKAFRLYTKEVGLKNALTYWYAVRIKAPMERVFRKESVFSFLKRRIKKKLHLR